MPVFLKKLSAGPGGVAAATAYFNTPNGAAEFLLATLNLMDAYNWCQTSGQQCLSPALGPQLWDLLPAEAYESERQSMFNWWLGQMDSPNYRVDAVRAYMIQRLIQASANPGFQWPVVASFVATPNQLRAFRGPGYPAFITSVATYFPQLFAEVSQQLGFDVTESQSYNADAAANAGYDLSRQQQQDLGAQVREFGGSAEDAANCRTGNPFIDIPCQLDKMGQAVKTVAIVATGVGVLYLLSKIFGR